MPGYAWDGDSKTREKFFEDDALLLKAIKKGIRIIPTLNQTKITAKVDSKAKMSFVKDFLRRFHEMGGEIVLGSDIFNQTLEEEVQNLIDLNILNNQEILKVLTYNTPLTIFPNRKIGKLAEGYEASFLVFDENVLNNNNALYSPLFGVKEGLILE